MELGILMAITEDMTSNTLQQRMIPTMTRSKFCIIENRQQPGCFLHSLSVYKSLKAVSSRFQVILRGSSFSTPRGGLCRKRRQWSKFCVIEDIVVSYTSKVEIPVSRYL